MKNHSVILVTNQLMLLGFKKELTPNKKWLFLVFFCRGIKQVFVISLKSLNLSLYSQFQLSWH